MFQVFGGLFTGSKLVVYNMGLLGADKNCP